MTEILKKGENISLTKIITELNDIVVAVKWQKKSGDTVDYEIDVSAFLLNNENKVRNDADFVFYNQPNTLDNSIVLKNTLFKISLNAISQDIQKINFVLTLHDGKEKQQNFGMLDKISVELFNFTDKQKLVSYELENINSETALVLTSLYRYNLEWKFKAVGQGYNDGLGVLAKNFGVDVEDNSTQIEENPVKDSPVEPAKIEPEKTQEIQPEKLTDSNSQAKSKKHKQKNTAKPQKQEKKVDIHNTDMMTKEDHYQPIVEWFKNKSFIAEIHPDAMDTSGFFDEVAIELGDNYDLLKVVSNTIKRRQMANKRTAYINFDNYQYNLQQIEAIKKFCKQLYEYSFVAKYFFNKEENKAVLHLQSATKIINFFNGEWLEWYAFMKIAKFCHQRKIQFSCTRNININLLDNSKYELDVFCLIDGMPLFIECKSGEYRGFIDKYSRLRRKLFMDKACFWFLISGETDEQVKGLTAMFDITFLNEKMLDIYCEDVFVKKNG